jgi:hypothetical protein
VIRQNYVLDIPAFRLLSVISKLRPCALLVNDSMGLTRLVLLEHKLGVAASAGIYSEATIIKRSALKPATLGHLRAPRND